MLISKRSRRESKLFKSRFGDPQSLDFALRQYHRCREEYYSTILHGVLLLAFGVLVALFGRSVWHLFIRHGEQAAPIWRYLSLGVVLLMLGSIIRRVVGKVAELRELKRDMARYRARIREQGESAAGPRDQDED